MSVKCLPAIYPGESAYSYLGRAYCHGGYASYSDFARSALKRPREYPDCNFANVLSGGFREALGNVIGLEELVLGHTLFKYYARFMPKEKLLGAYRVAMANGTGLALRLPMPPNRNGKLRYCPLCVGEDRERFGEAYFHIGHGVPGINVCPRHGCYLADTGAGNGKSREATIKPLELLLRGEAGEPAEASEIEKRAAAYVEEVIGLPLELDPRSSVDELVLSRLDGRYFSRRGERRNLELLCRDLASFYAGFRGFPITKERLGRMLKGKATNVLDWCLLAMFAGIPAAELCRLEGAGAPRQVAFDERVRELYSAGMKKSAIAAELGCCKEVVRAVLLGEYERPTDRSARNRPKKRDWGRVDVECCERLKAMAGGMPHTITKKDAAELLGLKDASLRNLPRLRAMLSGMRKGPGSKQGNGDMRGKPLN